MVASINHDRKWCVKEDGKELYFYKTKVEAVEYFTKRKKVIKGKRILMALLKNVNGKWQGVLQN